MSLEDINSQNLDAKVIKNMVTKAVTTKFLKELEHVKKNIEKEEK